MVIKKLITRYTLHLMLGIAAFLAYGLFAFQHGYYWDDWAFAWTREHLGFEGLLNQFSANRPIRAYWEGALSFLGANPANWQIYTLLMRWVASLAFMWVLNTIWGKKRTQNTLAAFFFLLYPGFTQHPVAITYQFFWTLYIFYFLSLGLMIGALKTPHLRAAKLGISFLLSTYTLFGLEYFFGLELIRALFIWIALSTAFPDLKERLQKTLTFYTPYLIALAGYLYWRFFLYKDTIYAAQDQVNISTKGIWTQLWDAVPLVSIGAWAKVFVQPFSPESGLSPRLALVMGAILLAGTLLLASLFKFKSTREAEYLSTQKAKDKSVSSTVKETDSQKNARSDSYFDGEWLLLSIALLLAAGIPFYAVNFPVELTFPEDRFTFPFMMGVSMLFAWLFSLIKNETQRFTLAALLISLAITTHIYNGDTYRREWRLQRLFAQQLFWRAPDIAPGTLILAEDDGVFPHNDDEAFAFLINWAYNPEQTSSELDYEYFYLSARSGEDLPSLKSGESVFKDHFAATFEGNTDKVLLLHFSPPSCLRILDPVYDADVLVAPRDVENVEIGSLTLPRVLEPALSLSKPRELISKNNDDFNPPEWLFGAEPERNWCYYFEKADLARQDEDWEKITKLGDKAFGIPFAPADAAEYIPFIEAYAHLRRYDDAQELTKIAAEKNPALRPMFCSLWQRLTKEGVFGKNNALLHEMQAELVYCPLY